MAPLALDRHQLAGEQAGEMAARRRRRDGALERKLGRGERAAVHQRSQHAGARRIADQGRDAREVGRVVHTSMLNEACSTDKRHALFAATINRDEEEVR